MDNYHHHARTTKHGREHMAKSVLEGRLSLREAAAECRLSRQSAAKWVRRYREAGVAGLLDRSSRPHRSPRSTSEASIMEVERLRRERWTGVRIAQQLGFSRATVSRVLRRLGLNRIRDLEPAPAVVRYEHAAPGDMLHLDIKRLVRIKRHPTASPATAGAASRASGPSSCMSPSTTTLGLPFHRHVSRSDRAQFHSLPRRRRRLVRRA
jgi:transposase